MEPDRIDREILRLLREISQLSKQRLAAAVGLAQSTCHEPQAADVLPDELQAVPEVQTIRMITGR